MRQTRWAWFLPGVFAVVLAAWLHRYDYRSCYRTVSCLRVDRWTGQVDRVRPAQDR